MPVRFVAAAAAILAVGCGLSACGGTQATKTVTVTAAAAPKPMAATRTAPNAGANKPRGSVHPATVMTACDANIMAKRGTTSCPFAQNVFYAYWQAEQNGDDAVRAYSPVTQRTYDMACVAGATVVCRAGDGSEVRFSRASLDRYDGAQADAYRCTHHLGPDADSAGCGDDSSGGTAPSAGSGATAGDGCDPSYEGACLDPNASDYDCQGGTGDGPEYTGTVTVVGDDHYGLDRNGDGIGCEP